MSKGPGMFEPETERWFSFRILKILYFFSKWWILSTLAFNRHYSGKISRNTFFDIVNVYVITFSDNTIDLYLVRLPSVGGSQI